MCMRTPDTFKCIFLCLDSATSCGILRELLWLDPHTARLTQFVGSANRIFSDGLKGNPLHHPLSQLYPLVRFAAYGLYSFSGHHELDSDYCRPVVFCANFPLLQPATIL